MADDILQNFNSLYEEHFTHFQCGITGRRHRSFVLVCRLNKIHSVDGEMYGPDSTLSVQLPVAYVNVDSLLLNYQFAIESNEILMKKQEIPDWI